MTYWKNSVFFDAETEGAGAPPGEGAASTTAKTPTEGGEEKAADAGGEVAGGAKPEPWYETRLRQVTARAKSLEEQLERERQGKTTPPPNADGSPTKPVLTEKDVEAKAAELAATREFNAACDKVWETGRTEFGDFASKLDNFKKLGGLPIPVIEAALETGVAHKVLHELGSNMDEAARILALSPLKMAVAVAKLGERVSAAKPGSKAPDPVTPIGGRGASAVDPADPDKMPLDKWIKWREKQIKDRE